MNHSSLYLPIASFGGADPILIPFFLFGIGGVIAITAIITRNQRQKAWYEVVRLSIEKGQPLSQLSEFDLNSPPAGMRSRSQWPRVRTPRHDLRSALILMAVSAGLHFGSAELNAEHVQFVPGFFLIPGFIGVALLINALIGIVFPPKSENTPTSSPKP